MIKKILVIGPILTQWSEIRFIKDSLGFFSNEKYLIDFMDPLSILVSPERFFIEWKNKITSILNKYDIFLGFSLGGVILQSCFSLFESSKKHIILFSTPSFVDETLYVNLNAVLKLVNESMVMAAIQLKNEYVFFPESPPPQKYKLDNPKEAAERLTYGLNMILNIDSRHEIKNAKIAYLHFIGEKSKLVNDRNVIVSSSASLSIVPGAGMRVLQNNLDYCLTPINEYLGS